MPEIPPEAIDAAAGVLWRDVPGSSRDLARTYAQAALEAAAPILAEAILTPLAKRHAMIPSDWAGALCGTCWNKDGSRAVSPCAELLAIAALLPESAEVPGA